MSDSIVVKTPVGRVLYDNISTTDKYYDGFTLTMTFDPADEDVVQMKQMIEQFESKSLNGEATHPVVKETADGQVKLRAKTKFDFTYHDWDNQDFDRTTDITGCQARMQFTAKPYSGSIGQGLTLYLTAVQVLSKPKPSSPFDARPAAPFSTVEAHQNELTEQAEPTATELTATEPTSTEPTATDKSDVPF